MIERNRKRKWSLSGLATLFAVAGLVWLTPSAEATIRVGNSEIQVVYEMNHAFQFDGSPGDNFEWVQWRNELRVEYEYQGLVTREGGLFDKNIKIPGVEKADVSFMYRGRFDPIYMVRDKYDEMYPHRIKMQHKSFVFPENGFREWLLQVPLGYSYGPVHWSVGRPSSSQAAGHGFHPLVTWCWDAHHSSGSPTPAIPEII